MHNFSARSHYPSPSRDAKTRYNASPTSPPLLLVMSHSLVRTEDVPAILDKPQVLHFVDVFVRQGGVEVAWSFSYSKINCAFKIK